MTPMEFAVAVQEHAHATVLTVTGDLDVAAVDELSAAVDRALTAAPGRLLIDLTPTDFLDSTGCSALMKAAKRGAAAGSPLELVVPPENWRVRRVVDFMQFGELLPVHDQPPGA